ncbi:MAG: phosphoglycerate dehydrogenase [Deltaproteobacteria bacterium]|nr:phosphoglycerate dehydrogenase [Deltaproteobacteria bacterium]MBW2375283.1 phosphoglycerate dehydrogenase [Deltaproteobacteria bacterium]
MSNVRVLVSDKLAEAGLRVLREAPGVELEFRPGMSEDELCSVIGDYDGLIIRSATQVTPRVVEEAHKLRVVGRAGIGVDNVDIPAASRRGIVVMNTPTGNSVTTAEHALTLLASLARKIPQAVASMRSGKWEKSKFQGREIAYKTLGIIGLGNIGRIVADRAQGLKMKVIGVDPVMSSDRAAELGIELVEFDELLELADFVTIHAPLTPETKNMFNDAAFEKMKSGALLVNAARGGIVDEEALARAITEGKIAGAALDVFGKEPIDPDHPLLGLDNVLCTPHLGASTSEAQERVAVEIAEQAVSYLQQGIVTNAVNVPALPQEIAERLTPYLDVAKALGSLIGQLDPIDVRELRVTCTGEAGELGVTPIARAALAGFLEHHLEEPVNPISAPYEAQERGIRLAEVKEASDRYATTVRVTVTGEKGIHTATGTPGRKGEPRLVGLEGYEIDAVMEGSVIIMHNQDRPGVIGSVGTLLGGRGINISRMQVGLDEKRGQALALWNVDSTVGSDALDDLRAIDHVSSVHTLRL